MTKNDWISTRDQLPKEGDDIEVTYDNGETVDTTVTFLNRRTCMMAGIAGGHGYFGPGFATDGTNTDYGLIMDTPTHWRYKTP